MSQGPFAVDSNGLTTHTPHPMGTGGPFGVDRDGQRVGFLQRIYLPDEVVLVSLFGTAELELSLGLAFPISMVWSFLLEDR